MLVELGAGPDDRLDHPLLSGDELGCGAGQQPSPTSSEQPDTVEGQLHRGDGAKPGHGRGHGGHIPGAQDRVRNVRQMLTVGMRSQARNPSSLEPIPQRAHGPLRAPIKQKAHRQRHPDDANVAQRDDAWVAACTFPRGQLSFMTAYTTRSATSTTVSPRREQLR